MSVNPVLLSAEPSEPDNLAGMTVAELRTMAKTMEISGCSTMKKEELMEAVQAAQGAEVAEWA